MDLDKVEQLRVLMCGPRSTSVLHDGSGDDSDDSEDGVRCVSS